MYLPKSPENQRSSKAFTNSPTAVNEESVNDVNYRELCSESLFKHIENLEWRKAKNALLHESSADTRQWVIKDTSDRPGWRRLPIHEACIRQPPAEIVSLILDVFPSCSQLKDNYERTPLHYAVIHHASPQVMYLLLDSNYGARKDKDFYGMTPLDYCSSSTTTDVESILSLDENKISVLASQIRKKFNSSLNNLSSEEQHHSSVQHTYRLNSRIQNNLQAFNSLQLEEELAQARVEADAAYAQRDVALSEKDEITKRIKELEDILQLKQEEIDDMQDLSERNRHLSAILKHFEEKNKSLLGLVSEKDKKIELLKDEVRKNNEAKVLEASALATKYHKEKEKLMSTVSVLTEKLSGMTNHLNDAVSELEQSHDEGNVNNSIDSSQTELQCLTKFKKYAEEKMNSLEEMVEVYRSAANALQIKCHALEQKCVHENNNANVSWMKNELVESERIRKALEKEVSLLTSYNIKTNERVEMQEEMLNDYRLKLERLEEGYYQLTEQLIERTMILCQARHSKEHK